MQIIPAQEGRISGCWTTGHRLAPRLLTAVALLLLTISACGGPQEGPDSASNARRVGTMTVSAQDGAFFVDSAWIPAPPGPVYPVGSNLMALLLLENRGSTWDDVTGASTPITDRIAFRRFGIEQDFIAVPNDSQTVERRSSCSTSTDRSIQVSRCC